MNSPIATQTIGPMANLRRLSRVGVWASAAASLLLCVVLVYFFWGATTGDPQFVSMLMDELEITDHVNTFTGPQTWVAAILWLSTDFLGLMFMLQVNAMFRGFLRSGVFTQDTPRRLRRIGWIILSLAPVSILSGFLAGLLVSVWQGAGLHASIGIDDTDVYAIIIGLVITAVSHIMLEASRLSDENQAFV